MESNPYQPPAALSDSENPPAQSQSFPMGLVALCVLAALQIVVAGLLILGGLVMGSGLAVVGGFVSFGFHIAILVGLCLKQEWARVMLIWLCYVGIASIGIQCLAEPLFAVPLISLEIVTLVFAHSRRVRNATRHTSLAKTYVYRENDVTGKESLPDEHRH